MRVRGIHFRNEHNQEAEKEAYKKLGANEFDDNGELHTLPCDAQKLIDNLPKGTKGAVLNKYYLVVAVEPHAIQDFESWCREHQIVDE